MKHVLLFGFVLAFTAANFGAQPPAPSASQVFAFFCNQDFTSCPVGFPPMLSPIQLADGQLYVPTFYGGQGSPDFGGTVTRSSTAGQSLVIHTFASVQGQYLAGNHPAVGFAQGTDGALYGVTLNGGTHNFGVFYKLQRSGRFQVLYNFCSLPGCAD